MVASPFVVLTGASGSGKTTIAQAIELLHPEFNVYRFDTIGVPSAEVMATFGTGHQPGGAWQRAMTLQWFERIAPVHAAGHPVLFEGQMRITFVQEAIRASRIAQARIILVECDDDLRAARLTHDRLQPELANENMMGWSRYLHQEAVETGYEILDTGANSLQQSIARIVSYLSGTN